jgi:hypothetical protein
MRTAKLIYDGDEPIEVKISRKKGLSLDVGQEGKGKVVITPMADFHRNGCNPICVDPRRYLHCSDKIDGKCICKEYCCFQQQDGKDQILTKTRIK